MSSRVIWQYWETVGEKPAFVDGLYEIAKRNAGAKVIQVTPTTLKDYLPCLPTHVLNIRQIEHKADMIRAMLVMRHGGMWLDSDALVLRRLDGILDLLDTYEFVCFNDEGRLAKSSSYVRVNCFASRSAGQIVSEWVQQQHSKFPRTEYGWEEIGAALLHSICLRHAASTAVLPLETICPIPWNRVERFLTTAAEDADSIVNNCHAVMLSNSSLKSRAPVLRTMTVDAIAAGNHLLGAIMRKAIAGSR
jgi:hypothetical protein